MKTFFASVCTAAVVAGILTATAATNLERAPARQDMPGEINRTAKTDRWPSPPPGAILVKTISIPAAAYRQESAQRNAQESASPRELSACEPLVSPLADRVASRRARHCAT